MSSQALEPWARAGQVAALCDGYRTEAEGRGTGTYSLPCLGCGCICMWLRSVRASSGSRQPGARTEYSLGTWRATVH